jgi:hypothetical protein
MVLISRGPAMLAEPLDRLIEQLSIEIVAYDERLARESRIHFCASARDVTRRVSISAIASLIH